MWRPGAVRARGQSSELYWFVESKFVMAAYATVQTPSPQNLLLVASYLWSPRLYPRDRMDVLNI